MAKWLLIGTTIAAATVVLHSLVAAAAQWRSALGAFATLASDDGEPRVVRAAPPPPTQAAEARPASLPAPAPGPEIPPAVIVDALEREAAAIPGPPSAYEFTRLLESGLLGEEAPGATEELRRALAGAAAF